MPNSPSVLYNREYFDEILKDSDSKAIELQKKSIKEQRNNFKNSIIENASNKVKFENIFEEFVIV